jgi:hypothetical protein
VQTGVIKQPTLQLSVPISFERAHLNSDDDFFFFRPSLSQLGRAVVVIIIYEFSRLVVYNSGAADRYDSSSSAGYDLSESLASVTAAMCCFVYSCFELCLAAV